MKTTCFLPRILSLLLLLIVFQPVYGQKDINRPSEHFGFKPGADRMLFNYEALISYLEHIEEASGRMEMKKIGQSPEGKPMYGAFFSTPENLDNLDKLRRINEELALNENLTPRQRQKYQREGKVFFVATLSMHASEVGPSQAAPLIAYRLATTQSRDTLSWLNDVVYMMVPSHNPDGMNMVVEHYNKYKGTQYEGSSMPGVYHKYVGHDNNRDFVTLTQQDNRAVSRLFSQSWYPQVMVEKHQMGSTGPRYFVPPNHDPIAENIDAGIWNWMGIFGMNMIKDMTRENLAGVSQHYAFDNYWPGSTETCIWKNVIGFLTECASAQYATPIYVEENELSVWGKGLSEYKKSINMPLPWEGGWWKLSDIMDYELTSTFSAIKTCSNHKADILKFRNDMCRKQVEKGKSQPPYYYVFPRQQHDQSELVDLINLLKTHGIDRYKLDSNMHAGGHPLKKGDLVIPLAQPFRPFIKEVLERQDYPVRHYTPGGKMIKPYDITSWSLPLHKGLAYHEMNKRSRRLEQALVKIQGRYSLNPGINHPYQAMVLPVTNNESYQAAFMAHQKGLEVRYIKESRQIAGQMVKQGAFIIPDVQDHQDEMEQIESALSTQPRVLKKEPAFPTHKLDFPKVALIETWLHDMDAGWTRYLFDRYRIGYQVLRPGQITNADLQAYDVLVFPDNNKSVLMQGQYEDKESYRMSSYPPEYTKGMGEEGLQKVMKYLDQGGKVVAWGRSTELFMGKQTIRENGESETFTLPVANKADEMEQEGLYCPGSLVRIQLNPNSVFHLGMPEDIGVFYRGDPVFATRVPLFDMDRRVLAHFPDENILMSGYAEKPQVLAGEPSHVWLGKGRGEMVLFSFRPQFRASTPADYKMIFNSLLFSRQ